MRVALLTGGGDCPGLNAVIYAAVKKGINKYGDEFVGFLHEQFQFRGLHQPGLDQEFHPVNCFVGFFFDNTHLGDEVGR